MANEVTYNDPKGGTPSEIGSQIRTDHFQKKALIELKKEQYFSQLADTTAMPKNMGKTIKRFHYLPLLDDRNLNDQGLNAAGASINNNWEIVTAGVASGDYANEALAITAAGTTGAVVRQKSGSLYGSSKDVGTISGKMPALSENGGRVNRVGFKRIELEGSIAKFGFFDEYTQESLDFDSDAELEMHINREMLRGANEITEDLLQIDLLSAAGVTRFGGVATQTSEISGIAGEESLITYEDLMRLSIELDNNRTPKSTKVITGSRMVDTRVVEAARVMYIGSELIPLVKKMTDLFGNQAFISVAQYGAASATLNGEIGQVDQFKIVVVPEMMHWAGVGKAEGINAGYRATAGKYDVFPMLVVGSESFTTIGFQTDGKSVKFKIVHKKPGEAMVTTADPFGETGLMSIKWYYGFMTLRPERIALCKTVAEL